MGKEVVGSGKQSSEGKEVNFGRSEEIGRIERDVEEGRTAM